MELTHFCFSSRFLNTRSLILDILFALENKSSSGLLSKAQFCKPRFKILITCSGGLTQLFPGAHLASTRRSKSSSLKKAILAHFTASKLFLWSVPSSLNFRMTFGYSPLAFRLLARRTACLKGDDCCRTELLTATFTWPVTKDLSTLDGVLQCRYTDGVREDLLISWSAATNILASGAVDFLPLTPVEMGSPDFVINTYKYCMRATFNRFYSQVFKQSCTKTLILVGLS